MDMNRISRRGFLGGAATLGAALAAGVVPASAVGSGMTRVSGDGFSVHAEPLVAVNPRDPRNLLAAGQAWNATGPTLATYVSFDGGRSWRSNGGLPMPAGTLAANDVTVAFDEAGRGFVCGTTLFGNGTTLRGIQVWRTSDGGRSFGAPVPALSGQSDDHPWLAAAEDLHVVWSAQNLTALGYGRSVDHGTSFEAARSIAAASRGAFVSQAMVAAGRDGVVGAVYHDVSSSKAPAGGPPPGMRPEWTTDVQVVCSRDGGTTFDPPVSLGRAATEIIVPGATANLPSGPTVATGRHDGALHVAFVTHQQGASTSDIVLCSSPDGGRTWDGPTTITPPGAGAAYFQPQLAVDDLGRVGVSAFALGPRGVDVVLLLSEPGRLRFGPPITVTTTPFDPTHGSTGGKHGAWWIGDYQGLAAGPVSFHPLWNDTRTGNLELFTATVFR
jgi:hypothetical protein